MAEMINMISVFRVPIMHTFLILTLVYTVCLSAPIDEAKKLAEITTFTEQCLPAVPPPMPTMAFGSTLDDMRNLIDFTLILKRSSNDIYID